jgi:hypothetical protein
MQNVVASDPQTAQPTSFLSGDVSFTTPQPQQHQHRSGRPRAPPYPLQPPGVDV